MVYFQKFIPKQIRNIPGFPNYLISDDGESYRNKGKILSLKAKIECKKGYFRTKIFNDSGVPKSVAIHRAVLAAFNGGFRDDLQVNHKDFDKKNNNLNNLEWVTNKENFEHRVMFGGAGLYKSGHGLGESHRRTKLKDENIREIRLTNQPLKDVAKKFGVSIHTIHAIRSKRNWKYI